jgi:DNA-directed RNA polymerase specialized sigma24 family protein
MVRFNETETPQEQALVPGTGSVTHWIHQLMAGEQAASQKLWERYFRRLVVLARKRFRGIPRCAADEEDVALSAFDSLLRRAREGRIPKLLDRNDLWQLLVLIAGRKASNLAKHDRRQRRGGGKVRHASALPDGDGSEQGLLFADLIGREPEPVVAAQMVEEYERLLDRLDDDVLRSVAVWKLEGYTSKEIAVKLGRAPATVERKLRLIRDTWAKEVTP